METDPKGVEEVAGLLMQDLPELGRHLAGYCRSCELPYWLTDAEHQLWVHSLEPDQDGAWIRRAIAAALHPDCDIGGSTRTR